MQAKGKMLYIICWSLVAILQGIIFFGRLGDNSYSVWLTVLHGVTAVLAAFNVVAIIVKNKKEKRNEAAEA